MRIINVNLPEQLIDALEQAQLVVFAGAGISMGDPSNLPSFKRLTEQIADGSGLTCGPQEALDRFLGRLDRQGTRVHEMAGAIIGDESSLPTDVHRAIVRLFGDESRVRVVTTNFDRHFENAWADVFPGGLPRVFEAPALPLGRDFAGIVHVHGPLDPAHRMVLTDADFGRAYVTEGWATRFLSELFENFTVLFVGYSHEDVLVDYLARGLPAGRYDRRFALVDSAHDADAWRRRGIEPIQYDNEDGTHSVLRELLESWALSSARTLGQHSDRVRDLVMVPPSEVGEDVDYLRDAFRDGESDVRRAKARSFYANAHTVEWLDWAWKEGLLAPLMGARSAGEEEYRDLAWWVARNYAVDHTDELLLMIADKGGWISPILWTAIAQTLHAADDLPPDVLRVWIPLLTEQEPIHSQDYLAYLIHKCRLPEQTDVFLHLVEHLLGPRVKLESSLLFGRTPKVSAEPNSNDYWMDEVFENLVGSRIGELAVPLASLLVSRIEAASRVELIGTAGAFDRISFGRSAIEAHEQDAPGGDYGSAIDALRDIANWALESDPALAASWIECWTRSPATLIQRLGLYALSRCDFITPEEKIRRVLDERRLEQREVKYELYSVLRDNFSQAGADLQEQVVAQAFEVAAQLEPDHGDYYLFNLFTWLSDAAPGCSAVDNELRSIQAKHPEFEPREHPDLNAWHGPADWVRETSPLSESEVLRASVEGIFELISDDPGAQEPLLDVVAAVSRDHMEWSLGVLASVSSVDGARARKLVSALVAGWESSDVSVELRERALLDLESVPDLASVVREASSLLRAWASGAETTGLTRPGWEVAARLAERLWIAVEQEDPITDPGEHGWQLIALNHSASRLVAFWLNYLAMLRKSDPSSSWRIPPDVRDQLTAMVRADGVAGSVVRTTIFSDFSFLLEIDPDWTMGTLVPMLDASSEYVDESWEGLLTQGSKSRAAWDVLLPAYRGILPVLSGMHPRIRTAVFGQSAFLCAVIDQDPVASGLAFECLRAANADEQGHFTHALGEILARSDGEALEAKWNTWISGYLQRRGMGVPNPLASEEYEQLLDWPIRMTSLFCELVRSLVELPTQMVEKPDGFLPRRLQATGLPEANPECSLLLLLLTLKCRTDGPTWDIDVVKQVVRRCSAGGASKELAAEVGEQLVRLGHVQGASDMGTEEDPEAAQE